MVRFLELCKLWKTSLFLPRNGQDIANGLVFFLSFLDGNVARYITQRNWGLFLYAFLVNKCVIIIKERSMLSYFRNPSVQSLKFWCKEGMRVDFELRLYVRGSALPSLSGNAIRIHNRGCWVFFIGHLPSHLVFVSVFLSSLPRSYDQFWMFEIRNVFFDGGK